LPAYFLTKKKDKEENPFNNFKLGFIDMKLQLYEAVMHRTYSDRTSVIARINGG